MIFSIIENVSAQEKNQKVLVKGKPEEIATELENIMTELLKRGFPEELIMSAMAESLHSAGILERR